MITLIAFVNGEILGKNKIVGVSDKIDNVSFGIWHRNVRFDDAVSRFFPNEYGAEGFKAIYRHFFEVENLK